MIRKGFHKGSQCLRKYKTKNAQPTDRPTDRHKTSIARTHTNETQHRGPGGRRRRPAGAAGAPRTKMYTKANLAALRVKKDIAEVRHTPLPRTLSAKAFTSSNTGGHTTLSLPSERHSISSVFLVLETASSSVPLLCFLEPMPSIPRRPSSD